MDTTQPPLKAYVTLRESVRIKLQMMFCSPAREIRPRVEEFVDWVIQVAEENPDKIMVFGLTPSQIFHCKAFYEAYTGKKAEDI